jgi:hypothetical protein
LCGGKEIMKKKIVGMLVCTLLIAAAVLPAAGIMNIGHTKTEPNNPQPAATKTGYFTVPAAAFIAEDDTISYHNYASWLTGRGAFCAPVYLPNEATVTKLIFFYSDLSSGYNAELGLFRYPFGATEELMSYVETSGNTGNGYIEDNTIDYADIDNYRNSYFLWFDNPANIYDIYFLSVIIEYTYETGGSSEENIAGNEQVHISQDSVVTLKSR